MPEKEPREKVAHIFGWGRLWRVRRLPSLSRKSFLNPKYEPLGKLLLLLGLSFVIALILSPQPQQPLKKYQVGALAQQNVRATGDLLVEDAETTRQRQKETMANIPPVFDLDEATWGRVRERLHEALSFMRQQNLELQSYSERNPEKAPAGSKARFGAVYKEILKHKPEFDRLFGVSLPNSTFYLLAKAEFSPTLEALINQVIGQFFHQGVVGNRSIPGLETREILLRRLPSKQEQKLQAPFPFGELEEIRRPVASYCREVASEFSPADRFLVCDVVQYLLVPNVSLNVAETQERRQASLRELQPTYYKVKKGELILREGERLTPLHVAKLQAQSRIYPQNRGLLIFLGTFLCVAVVLGLTYQVARLTVRRFPERMMDLLFLSVLLITVTLMNLGLVKLGHTLESLLPEVGQNLVFALPIGLAAIFAAIFLGLETGVVTAFLAAALVSLEPDKPLPLFLFFVTAGLVGVWGVRNYRQRSVLIRTGFLICLANLVMLTAFKLLEYPFTFKELAVGWVFALSGGLFTGILTLGLIPVVESVFPYYSNSRLQELLNLDQPILRELMLLAPGTYHHSLVVGQMVEAAAEAIGANPLVAKAAAYYHDVGKVKKPAYFVENQLGAENKHEKLAPSMSSLILISHVKDGVELARKHKLGDHIADIIQQHHGTCYITFFYNKAKEQAANPQAVNIDDYRYPGPKPQTKEAGVVLLADQIEAASRTLEDPTPARIQGLVQKIINKVFSDGQLDECELTLKELHLIAKSCNKILSGIFHQRIQYPQPTDKKKVNGDLDKQPPKKGAHKSRQHQDKSREDLKRLGLG